MEQQGTNRILIVEDSPTQGRKLQGILENEGFVVEIVPTAEKGLELLDTKAFDLVITDILMPGMSGYEFCRQIKSHPDKKNIPVILLTALSDPMDIVQGLECGADNFLTKPYQADYLVGRVKTMLASQDLPEEEKGKEGVEVVFLGKKLTINSGKEQILNLLFSTFEDVISTNRELRTREAELANAQRKLDQYARRLEGQVRSTENKYQRLMEKSQDAIFILDTRGTVREVNRRGEELLGQAAAEIIGNSYEKWLPIEDVEQRKAQFKEFLAEGMFRLDNARIQRKEGDYVFLDLSSSIGEVNGEKVVLVIAHDVTESHRSQEAVSRLAALVEGSDNAIYAISPEGTVLSWNPAAERLFGYKAEEIIGQPVLVLPATDRQAEAQKNLQKIGEGKHVLPMETVGRHKDGRPVDISLTLSSIRKSDGQIIGTSVIARDIGEKKRAERRLLAQHATTAILATAHTLEEAAQPLLQAISTNLDWDVGHLWKVEKRAKLLRCLASWFLPGGQAELFVASSQMMTFPSGTGLPGRSWAAGQPVWETNLASDVNCPRFSLINQANLRSGSAFPVLLENEVLAVLEFFCHETREPDESQLAMMSAIGSQIGQFIQRKRLEEQFHHSQKMEAVGQLAGGIAHDFNNLLTIVSGYTEVLLRGLRPGDPTREHVSHIKEAGERAASLTRQLLAFSRKQVLEAKILDLNLIAHNTEKMLQRLIGEDVRLSAVLDENLRPVKADPGQIEQVILNLVVNARDAMPQGGKLTIETRNVDVDRAMVQDSLEVKPGSYSMIAVSDTGHGMDAATQARIFEPFFTTKGPGKGTGLGLATVYGIVRQSGGYITVTSEIGQGTTFRVYLPSVAGVPAGKSLFGLNAIPPGTETILLVEDEDGVRALTCHILQKCGYTVLEAGQGNEAIRICEEFREPIHLLLTDVVMPNLGGPQLAKRLLALRPQIKVLFMSGYADETVVRHGTSQEEIAFLHKPFTAAALAQKVRNILDK